MLTFNRAFKWLGTQVCDTVALQVLSPCKGLPAAFLWTCKTSVIIVLPEDEDQHLMNHSKSCETDFQQHVDAAFKEYGFRNYKIKST